MKSIPTVIAICYMQAALSGCSSILAQPPAENLFGRKYRNQETYRYKLTTRQLYNGEWKGTTIAVCELKVVRDPLTGVYHDVVRWVSREDLSPKDTVNQTAQATRVAPYRISLDPKGKLDIPKIEVASMTGPITDLNTFFVAVSPQLGATRLAYEKDTLLNPEPVKGNFSNGKTILHGSDCLQTSVRMDKITPENVALTSFFLPPAKSCLPYLSADMQLPVVKDTMNNIQMAMPVGKARFNVQYGREFFVIRSVVRRSDGKIIHAEMANSLSLKLKLDCDSGFGNCKGEFPFVIERNLTLELL